MTGPPDDSPGPGLETRLAALETSGPPQLARLARWMRTHPDEVAFHSARGLAAASGANASTVMRLSRALGFEGWDACRRAFQAALRTRATGYAGRASALSSTGGGALAEALGAAQAENAAALFTPATAARVGDCAGAMLAAPAVVAVGVRSCFSLAHYFSYLGAMAFPNIQPTPAQPGAIMDTVSALGPGDVVLAITFAHYSAEIVRATEIARATGARVVALTDYADAPVASGAWRVFEMPMAGPGLMPSLAAGFHLVEWMIAEMAARTPEAADRIADFETRILRLGGYVAR